MKKIAAIIIMLLFLVSPVFAQAPNLPTPQVSGCDALMELDVPKTIYLDPEVAIVVQVNVTNVRCTASHVYIDIEGIRPDIIFTLAPDFYQSVLPNQTVQFNLTMPPSKSLNKSEYAGIYWIRTNNKWFNEGEVKITSAEKPAEKKSENTIRDKREANGEEQATTNDIANREPRSGVSHIAQSLIVALIILVGIFGAAYYYFKNVDKGEKRKTHADIKSN